MMRWINKLFGLVPITPVEEHEHDIEAHDLQEINPKDLDFVTEYFIYKPSVGKFTSIYKFTSVGKFTKSSVNTTAANGLYTDTWLTFEKDSVNISFHTNYKIYFRTTQQVET